MAKSATEIIQEFAQETLSSIPVLILGSGSSAPYGVPGMTQLASYLCGLPVPTNWVDKEVAQWTQFKISIGEGKDLESALDIIKLSDRQVSLIVNKTRSYLISFDEAVFYETFINLDHLVLTRLYKYLFGSTRPTIDVVTPNYDRLAEYAADAGGYECFTGFSHGYLQTFPQKIRAAPTSDTVRTVCIWKVHGSLDWVVNGIGDIMGSRISNGLPIGYSPLMVTPGANKFRMSYNEPFRSIIAWSDDSLEKARSYFCVGYGFNDEHLQTKLVQRCRSTSIPLTIITKSLTPATSNFLKSGNCKKYLAIESGLVGSRAYMADFPDGIDLETFEIWRLDKFLDFTIGSVS